MSFATSLYSFLTGTDLADVQATIDTAQAANQTQAFQDYAPGGKTYAQIAATQGTQAADKAWQQVQNDYQTGHVGDVTQEVSDAFSQGLSQGQQNVKGFFANIIDGIFNTIPWQAWVIGAIVLFVWLGGLTWLKRYIAKK